MCTVQVWLLAMEEPNQTTTNQTKKEECVWVVFVFALNQTKKERLYIDSLHCHLDLRYWLKEVVVGVEVLPKKNPSVRLRHTIRKIIQYEIVKKYMTKTKRNWRKETTRRRWWWWDCNRTLSGRSNTSTRSRRTCTISLSFIHSFVNWMMIQKISEKVFWDLKNYNIEETYWNDLLLLWLCFTLCSFHLFQFLLSFTEFLFQDCHLFLSSRKKKQTIKGVKWVCAENNNKINFDNEPFGTFFSFCQSTWIDCRGPWRWSSLGLRCLFLKLLFSLNEVSD